MRRKWVVLVALGLVAVPGRLGAGETTAAKSVPAGAARKVVPPGEAAPGKKSDSGEGERATPREASAMEFELQQLREMIVEQARELETQRAAMREQQQKMDALTAAMREARASRDAAASGPGSTPVSLAAVAQSQKELGAKVGKIEKELTDTKKSVESRLKGFGPFSFSGDLRVRYEPFFGQVNSSNAVLPNRHRERFRLRVNASAKFSDEFSGGFGLASGDLNDPISTNQTMTGFFVRKPIAIDRAYLAYQPRRFKQFQLTAGKWAYTWHRTELTWDNDLNPEGLSQALAYSWKDSFLQRLAVVAFQLNVLESSGGKDTAVFGEQLQAGWKLHDRIKLGTYVGFYNYRQPNAIAANQGTAVLAGNTNTNIVGTLPSGAKAYASRFAVLDAILRLDVDTGLKAFPLMLQFDFAQNTRACGNLAAFAALPPASRPACNSRQRHGYWSEVQFGRTQEAGDMRFGYTFIRVEREAVVSAFNFSDLRQATNVANHRLEYYYQWNKNIQVGFTGLFGRSLGRVGPTPGVTERFLKRLQFDMIYKF